MANIGFDAAISRAISLLGIPDEEVSSRGFVPGYPIGLGVCSVRPIEMARAFSVIASGGKEITPMAIRTVEDKTIYMQQTADGIWTMKQNGVTVLFEHDRPFVAIEVEIMLKSKK